MKITINEQTKVYNLKIWDTDGKYKNQVVMWIKLVKPIGILLFYDITRNSTFKNLHNWFKEIYYLEPKIPIFLIGAKENEYINGEVPYGEEQYIARQYKCLHFFSFVFEEKDTNIIKCIIKEILYPSQIDYDYGTPYLTDKEFEENEIIISPAEDAIFFI